MAALMLACSYGRSELARMLLLEGNADINIRDNVSKYMWYDYLIDCVIVVVGKYWLFVIMYMPLLALIFDMKWIFMCFIFLGSGAKCRQRGAKCRQNMIPILPCHQIFKNGTSFFHVVFWFWYVNCNYGTCKILFYFYFHVTLWRKLKMKSVNYNWTFAV